jgi:hypothetical protein
MTYFLLASRAVLGFAALALIALAALHVLKPEVDPARNMISHYALGRYGWVMAICFAAFAAASACLFVALIASVPSLLGHLGLGFLVAAAFGLVMAACFPMDPVSTPPGQRSFSGKMHVVSFLMGVPCQLLAVLLISLALGSHTTDGSLPLLVLTAIVWLSLAAMIAIMLRVGAERTKNVRWSNRLFMVAYGVWLIVVAWPIAR